MENCEFLNDSHFKVNLQFHVNSVEEGLHWVKQFEDQNSVILRKGQMRPSNKADIFKVSIGAGNFIWFRKRYFILCF